MLGSKKQINRKKITNNCRRNGIYYTALLFALSINWYSSQIYISSNTSIVTKDNSFIFQSDINSKNKSNASKGELDSEKKYLSKPTDTINRSQPHQNKDLRMSNKNRDLKPYNLSFLKGYVATTTYIFPLWS